MRVQAISFQSHYEMYLAILGGISATAVVAKRDTQELEPDEWIVQILSDQLQHRRHTGQCPGDHLRRNPPHIPDRPVAGVD